MYVSNTVLLSFVSPKYMHAMYVSVYVRVDVWTYICIDVCMYAYKDMMYVSNTVLLSFVSPKIHAYNVGKCVCIGVLMDAHVALMISNQNHNLLRSL